MNKPLGPSANWAEKGAQVAARITRVFLVQHGVKDGLPVYSVATEGPAEAAFLEDATHVRLYSDPAHVDALRYFLTGARRLVLTH